MAYWPDAFGKHCYHDCHVWTTKLSCPGDGHFASGYKYISNNANFML